MPIKHWKYFDDLTVAEALNLKEKLENVPDKTWEAPLNFHNRTKYVLPTHESKVQERLYKLHDYAIDNEMKINIEKSKVMLYNTAKPRYFSPKMIIDNNTLDVVDEMKVLAVKILSDLKWHRNTGYYSKIIFQT